MAVHKLSSKQRKVLQREFAAWDADKSGFIDLGELGAMLKSLHINLSEKSMRALMFRFDEDQSGTIDFSEFCEMMGPYYCVDPDDLMPEKELKRLISIFSKYDRDGDGLMDTRELGLVLRELGMRVGDKHIRNIIDIYDTDGSGNLSFQEFAEMMRSPM
jgi:calmodulin